MKKVKIQIRRKDDSRDLPLPRYATSGSSGMDLHADVKNELTLQPGGIKLVSCGKIQQTQANSTEGCIVTKR